MKKLENETLDTNNREGGVIWITGLSGAGKTTVAKKLSFKLKENKITPIVLDGDLLRKIIPCDMGFSDIERMRMALFYSELAEELAQQGHLVICAMIALYKSIHERNRRVLPNYLEVFLKVPIEELYRRDKRGIYDRQNIGTTPIVGLDISADFPSAPDIVIENHTTLSPDEAANIIFSNLKRHRLM